MIELLPPTHQSSNVHSIGFEGDRRGDLHVQFKDKDGNLTVRGYYKDVQRALFNALKDDRRPGSFIHENLKTRFEWVVVERPEESRPEGILMWPLPDALFAPPDGLFIPSGADTVEQWVACVNDQIRRKCPDVSLFG